MQAKESVSRAQAKIIFDRRNPKFRTMNYAAVARAAAVNEVAVQGNSGSLAERKQDVQKERPPAEGGLVEVVCMNPESGNTFSQLVNMTAEGQDEHNRDDRTCEDSAIVRADVREIYEQMAEGTVENDVTVENDGRQRYEREPGNAKKLTVKRDDERRARRVTEEDKELK